MTYNSWDDELRNRLGAWQPDEPPGPWETFARKLDNAPGDVPADSQDLQLRDTLRNFQTQDPPTGWDRIASSLDSADHAFDRTLHRKIQAYEAPFDPHSWHNFVGYWRDARFLRTKLILLKGIEAMAILLVLLTITHQGGFQPHPLPTPPEPILRADAGLTGDRDLASLPDAPAGHSAALLPDNAPVISTGTASPRTNATSHANTDTPSTLQPGHPSPGNSPALAHRTMATNDITLALSGTELSPEGRREATPIVSVPNAEEMAPMVTHSAESFQEPTEALATPLIDLRAVEASPALALAINGIDVATRHPATAEWQPPASRGHLEFGLVAQTDFNALRMPEDRLYSGGRQIVFPAKRLYSQGFGAGFTIARDHPRFALETGMIYTSKTYSPGRQLVVGDFYDNSTVDFQAMQIQLVTIPVQARYRLDLQGRLRTYVAGGFGVSIVAKAHMDVVASYHFASLAAGQNPHSNPALAHTIQESRRISEDLRDGAPFSSKNYVTANAGAGVEYRIPNHKKLFLQVMAQYQIPHLTFSNHNGKDLRAVAVQAGIRSALGY